ncbi:PEP-CTERM sorting domain-containing protein [Methylobacillus arboreus]|uniref:PEP-CTERM sorting domain-containing protein n=1 Tax=Methylobacillus arboreus TaxID=755170 RepID=UPI001E5A62DD|nr:PEP-CTERM sorting domain-containing protein [Methylobacillus arboreus]MCB5189705.1 PEP-CTERM sorting domain-containing protein [Methylobacillus arboreus]
MNISTKLAGLALASSAIFSTQALAIDNVWISNTPWGDTSLSDYAEWHTFNSTADTTPDFGANGAVYETTGRAFVASTGNLYSFSGSAAYTITLSNVAIGEVFDVYIRVATVGSTFQRAATLDGIEATFVQSYYDTQDFGGFGGGYLEEGYWKWEDVSTTTGLLVFNLNANAHTGFDQLTLATVASVAAVPEPSTYGMMAIGLGLLGLMGRRNKRQLS